MFSSINFTIVILWFLSAISDYSYFVYFGQLKEYRWDRFHDFLSTEQGKHFIFQFNIAHRALLIMIVLFLPLSVWLTKLAILLILVLSLIHDTYKVVKRKSFIRPVLTFKSSLLIVLPIFLEASLFFNLRDWNTLLLLLMARIFILGLITYGLNLITIMIKKFLINRARVKISRYQKLIVIGITGSYGKTSTKIFLDHILSKKFRVVTTPKHVNTEIGVAKFILKNDFSNYDIFIVEMGAYNLGEIKLICDIVKPKIGILTAISEQHLALFGNIKKTQQAKYELLRALPNDGLAVTNVDNKYCREFLSELTCQVATFGSEKEFNPTLLVIDIDDNLDGLNCSVNFRGEVEQVKTRLRGAHNVFNVLPCVLVADYLGMKKEEIRETITDLPQTVEIIKYGNCDFVNDSYNSNPEGFKAALDYLSKYNSERKRIVITRGMLELGSKSYELHEQIAGEISYAVDELVLITPDFFEPLKNGLVEKYNIKLITKFMPQELLEFVRSIKNSNSVILLENRIPEVVMREIKNNQVS